MGLGQSDVSQCELGRGIDGVLEVLPSRSQLFVADSHQCFLQMVIALKICFQDVQIHRSRRRQWRLVRRCEPCLDLTGDIAGYLASSAKRSRMSRS